MEKIECGMYVRTEKGIAKIIDRKLEPDDYYFQCWVTDRYLCICDDTEYLCDSDIIKASYNIIDLIEVGDYVNGELVEYIEVDSYKDYVINNGYWCNQENIKSIVTKEQFESMSYVIDKE